MKRRKVRVAAWLLCSGLAWSVGGTRCAGAEGYPALISALRTGNAGRVGELIGDGAALKATDARGNSALHWAALAGDSALVSRLLDAGLDPNATNAAGATPLHYATGEASSVRALLRAGARVDVRSLAGSEPLHTAAARPGGAEAVRLLIEAGADVQAGRPLIDTIGLDLVTALSLAAWFGDESAVELLLERGAAPGGQPGIPTMAVAAMTGRESVLEALLRRGAAVDFDDGFTGHALNNAFYGGHTALAAFLIEQGADLHRSSSFGERVPPMVWAAYNELGDPWAARALLARGVDPNERTGSGHTALDWALKRGETPLVALLRSHGAIESAPVREKKLPGNPVPTEPAAREAAIREAAQRAIDLLQRSSDRFLETGFVREQNCVSCHHQTLPAVAYGLARERGLRVDEVSLARQVKAQRDSWAPTLSYAYEMREPQPDATVNLSYGLLGLKSLGYAPDELTEAMVWYLARTQLLDGSFPSHDRRPPMEEGRVVGTAMSVAALRAYPQPVPRPELDAGIRRAQRWLASVRPEDPNQALFRLLGLAWSGAPAEMLEGPVRDLLAAQRADGGWGPLPGLESDAWATGMALVALETARTSVPISEARARGTDYLLRTQFGDGSWWVRSRSWPFQPHFDSGFPHGKDQWISAGATAWAAIALLRALPEGREPTGSTPVQELLAKHAVGPGAGEVEPAVSAAGRLDAGVFAREILPLFERSCTGCHAGEGAKSGYRLDSLESLVKPGRSGEPPVDLRQPENSLLFRYVSDQVEDLEMPPLNRRSKYPALTAAERERLRDWLAGGTTGAAAVGAPEWPQFRGPNSQGVADRATPPVHLGPGTNEVWRVPVPSGHSSPVLAGGRVFLTSFAEERLWLHCYDEANGVERWRRPCPAERFEKVHDYGNPASSTPATDGLRVYAYFGDYGLLAYDLDGRQVWSRPLPPPSNTYGNAASPALIGGLLVLARFGSTTNSSLLALDPETGETRWETPRAYGPMSQSTPVGRNLGARHEIIAFGGGRLSGFDPATGVERWFSPGFPGMVIWVPALEGDRIYAGGSGILGNSNPALPAQT